MRKTTTNFATRAGLSLAFLAFALLPAPSPAEEMPAMSVHDVARLRHVDEVAISPDGAHRAYTLVVPREPGVGEDGPAWSELWIAKGEGPPRPYVAGAVDADDIAWTADGSAVTFLAKRGLDEHDALYQIPLAGGEARRLLAHGDGIREYAFSPDGKRLAFLAKRAEDEARKELAEKGFQQIVYEEEWRPVELWMTEAEDGGGFAEPRVVALDGSASELSWSPSGDELAVALAPTSLIDDEYMARRVHVLDAGSGEVAGVIETNGKLGAIVWSPDGARLALLAGVDVNDPIPSRLMVVDAAGGAPRELNPGIAADAEAVAWQDAETLVWIASRGVGRSIERQRLAGEPQTLLAAGGPIWTDLSLAAGAAALVGHTPEHPEELYGWALEGEPARLSDSNPWLAERRLAAQEVVGFAARDGLALEGLLMRPLDRPEDEPAPLVLIVHGGPEAHFANGWLTTYSRPGQVLAGRGFAVFYPNYRGSTGRGLEFAKSSQGDPAGKEFDDLIDAVDHLIAAGLVDEDRVGVTGGSYGGYATAWSSTRHSGRFAAGVMFVGISDKVSKIGTSDIPVELYSVHARRWPWENWQLMLERSPIYHVEQARTPLLILGGDADPRVHPSQSLVLYRYLKLLGKTPVRYVIYPGEKHGNRKAAARLDYGLRAVRWLEHYLTGPGGDPPPHELDYGLEPGPLQAE